MYKACSMEGGVLGCSTLKHSDRGWQCS